MLATLKNKEDHWLSLEEIFVTRTYSMMILGPPDDWANELARSGLEDAARRLFFPDRMTRDVPTCRLGRLGLPKCNPSVLKDNVPFVALVPDLDTLPRVRCIGLFYGPATDGESDAAMLAVAWFQDNEGSLFSKQAEAILFELDWNAHAENFDH